MIFNKKILLSVYSILSKNNLEYTLADKKLDDIINSLRIKKYLIDPEINPSILWKIDIILFSLLTSIILFILLLGVLSMFLKNIPFIYKLLVLLPSPIIIYKVTTKIIHSSLINSYKNLVYSLETESFKFLQILLLFLTTEKTEIALVKTFRFTKDTLKNTYKYYYPIVSSVQDISLLLDTLIKNTPDDMKSYSLIFKKLMEVQTMGGNPLKSLKVVEVYLKNYLEETKKRITESIKARQGFVGLIIGFLFLIISILPMVTMIKPDAKGTLVMFYLTMPFLIPIIFFLMFGKKIKELVQLN